MSFSEPVKVHLIDFVYVELPRLVGSPCFQFLCYAELSLFCTSRENLSIIDQLFDRFDFFYVYYTKKEKQ